MGTLYSNQKNVYPKEIIKRSQEVLNGAVRLSAQKREGNLLKSSATEKLTLHEIANPKLGVMYDDFEIDSFAIDSKSGKVTVTATMSLTSVHENLSIFAKLVNQDSEKVLADLPIQSASNTYLLNYNGETVLSTDALREDITLIAYGAWGTKEADEAEIALVENYVAGAPQIKYTHEYPKKEEKYITFPQGKTVADVAEDKSISYKATRMAKDESRIMIALYRYPDKCDDLDYLCLFGPESGGKPLLGVPGKGTFQALSGSKFVYGGDNEPVARCVIRSIGDKTGGCMVVATSQEYIAPEGKIVLTKKADSLTYDMTGPWGIKYEGAWKVLQNFDYEFQITYTIQTGSGTLRKQTSYISSTKESSLEKIKPICLQYGCFGKGTKIVMSDGSQKNIEEISIGDFVRVENGENLRIKNIWRGTDTILTITMDGERQISVTADHPLLTPDGWRRAGDIREGMSLVKAWEPDVTYCVQSVVERGEGKIFNLETERDSACTLNANGIAAGDFLMQNSILAL